MTRLDATVESSSARDERSDRAAAPRGRLWRLCRKELRETLRDRRTIITLLLMPILVYPLLSMALNRFLLTSGSAADVAYQIGVENEADGEIVLGWLGDPRSKPPDPIVAASGGRVAEFAVRVTTEVESGPPLTLVEALRRGSIDVGVRIRRSDSNPKIELIAARGVAASESARRILIERMQWLRLNASEQVAATLPGYVTLPQIELSETMTAGGPSLLATIVPMVLVLMTITGAVYPAIDLTAGERERGTMEALMASPVPRFQVLWSKYIAVVAVAMLTAVVNLVAMFTTLWAGGLMKLLAGDSRLTPLAIGEVFLLLLLFSSFFSALLLSLTSFARSFKEAQSYLIPVMLLALAPAMLSVIPGVTLSGPLAVVPLVNIVLLAREVLAGVATPGPAAIAVLSTVGYAAAAIGFAARSFGDDAVTRSSEQSIGSLLRRPEKWSPVPSPTTAAAAMALLIPIYFLASGGLMQYLNGYRAMLLGDAEDLTIAQAGQLQVRSMFLSAIVLTAVFGGVPLIAAWLSRSRLGSTFRLHRATALSFVGALLLGLGAWAIAHESFVVADALGIGGLDEATIERTLKVLEAWTTVPPWVLVLCLAFAPAVIEELCFRGFLFSALRPVLTPPRTIVCTAVLFGLFHVITGGTLLVERFVPSTLLGLLLGWVAYRTGSVFPGMVMHFVHNGLLEMVGRYHERLDFLGTSLDGEAHLPLAWVAISTSIALIGAGLVFAFTAKGDKPVGEAKLV